MKKGDITNRLKGEDTAVLVKEQSGGAIIEGQSNLSESWSNALQEVTALKTIGYSPGGNVGYVARVDGLRDFNATISFTYGNATEAPVQKKILDKIKTSQDTTTRIFIGTVSYEDAQSEGKFTGFAIDVLIASLSVNSPNPGEKAGDMQVNGKGGLPEVLTDVLLTELA